MDDVVMYLQDTLGFSAHLENLPREQLKKLPFFLQEYDYYLLDFGGHRLILAGYRKKTVIDPLQLKKQAELISGYLGGMLVVFVLKVYTPFIRRRLIKEKINFIAPEEQLYLPDLLIDFRESIRQFRPYSGFLTPAAQLLLLYHIQVESLENRPFKDIAVILDYSGKTVTRVAEELKTKELCDITGTKEKQFQFLSDKRGIWDQAQSMMQSPVLRVYTMDADLLPEYPITYDGALSHYTFLSNRPGVSYALSKGDYLYLKSFKSLYLLEGITADKVRLEVWKYDPRILSNDEYVDPLSLYLCFRDDKNERVQGELPKLIEQVSW